MTHKKYGNLNSLRERVDGILMRKIKSYSENWKTVASLYKAISGWFLRMSTFYLLIWWFVIPVKNLGVCGGEGSEHIAFSLLQGDAFETWK